MQSRRSWPSTETRRRAPAAAVLGVMLGAAGCGGDGQQAGEPAITTAGFDEADKRRISVSGISSGGYMAVQSHVALAGRIGGAGIAAAGPYHCADGNVRVALGRCLSGENLEVGPFIEFAREAAAAGRIAPPDALASSRVWIFHSPADGVVAPAASRVLYEFYAAFVPEERIEYVVDVEAAHGWPVTDYGSPCGEMGDEFINDCEFDAAGDLLAHLYGELEPPGEAGAPRTADLSAFFPPDSNVAGEGYAYIPGACRNAGGDCRLHVVFHGCRQGADFLGDTFARQAGYNEWAETNHIVVVYPQVEKSLFNPQGCWDWWGYTDSAYDTRDGLQVAGVARLVDAFVAGSWPQAD